MGTCCSRLCGSHKIGRLYSLSSMRHLHSTNSKQHFTDMFNYQGFVFRRGLQFELSVEIFTPDVFDVHDIRIELTALGVGPKTIILDKRYADSASYGWKHEFSTSTVCNGKIGLKLRSPPDAIVGKYKAHLYLGRNIIGRHEFLLLFNPFCTGDEVFMLSFDDVQEYVFSDQTCIYMGTDDYIVPKSWDLAQFESSSIEAALMLLNCMPAATRSKAYEVSRQLSALINSNDDNGILMGNWSGKYIDGTSPMAWEGSAGILASYAKNGRPVKYAQCWVFCGVMCSVMRTLGIPCRCITNYFSLHDTDGSLKWEIFLDKDFNPINNGGDSCWNFHCWNEAWMKRPDLSPEHDGWQVLDATPQERSGGLFRLGPASKTAVKRGLVELPYDVGFVYAEVNADKVFYLEQPDGKFKQYMVKKNELGRLVITKKRKSESYEDVTKEYKDPDNLPMDHLLDEEHSRIRNFESSTTRAISIDIVCPSHVPLADDLKGVIIVRGLSKNLESILRAEALLVSYTGRNICKLYSTTENISSEEKQIDFCITRKSIINAVKEEFPFIKIKVYSYDSNNDELAFQEKIVSVKTPDIEISGVPEIVDVDSRCICRVSVSNPLNIPLTNTKLRINFTDDKPRKIRFKTVGSGKRIAQDIVIVPRCPGVKKLHVSLECEECGGFSNAVKFQAI